MQRSWFCAASVLALLVCLGFTGCTETDPGLNLVGGLHVIPVTSGMTFPVPGEPGIQFGTWDVSLVRVTYEDVAYDLFRGTPCTISTNVRSLISESDCLATAGIASDVLEQPAPALVEFSAMMEIRRMEPVLIPDGGDFDGDGVLNEDDNCTFTDNADQEDLFGAFDITDPTMPIEIGDMIGDACQIQIDTGAVSDSDGDGTADSPRTDPIDPTGPALAGDNCPWKMNPLQAETSDPVDGIGDACAQSAQVTAVGTGDPMLTIPAINFDIEIAITNVWVIVDFNVDTAFDCDWDAGSCAADLSQVEICQQRSEIATRAGCL